MIEIPLGARILKREKRLNKLEPTKTGWDEMKPNKTSNTNSGSDGS